LLLYYDGPIRLVTRNIVLLLAVCRAQFKLSQDHQQIQARTGVQHGCSVSGDLDVRRVIQVTHSAVSGDVDLITGRHVVYISIYLFLFAVWDACMLQCVAEKFKAWMIYHIWVLSFTKGCSPSPGHQTKAARGLLENLASKAGDHSAATLARSTPVRARCRPCSNLLA
jgi:hypothetical protein